MKIEERKSKIEWTNTTWNPWIGCTRISPGCDHCYAGREEDGRFRHLGRCAKIRVAPFGNWTPLHILPHEPYFFRGPVFQGDDVLHRPLHWRKPRLIFVGSRTDIFHDDIPFDELDRIFAIMGFCKQHTFQVLTKRPARMLEYLTEDGHGNRWQHIVRAGDLIGQELRDEPFARAPAWPPSNVWLGVTAEDQQRADERVPLLLQCPAAVRYVSHEPCLGAVDWALPAANGSSDMGAIDWLIDGGESGKGARPMHPDWARQDRDQCAAAGVSFFFKQWGEWVPFAAEARYAAGSLMPGNDEVIGGRCGGPHSMSMGKTTADGKTRHLVKWFGSDGQITRQMRAQVIYRDDHKWGKEMKQRMTYVRVGKKKAGRLLDGKLHDAMPEVNHG